MASCFINLVPDIKNKRYLELGVFGGTTFSSVSAKDKVSVDSEKPAMFQMTTDDFFAQLAHDVKFDVIYIDACHEYEYVVRDFNNALRHLSANGYVFVHDLIPPDATHTARCYCGDGYKVLHYIIQANRTAECYSLSINQGGYGLTVFQNPREPLAPDPENAFVSYEEFVNSSLPLANLCTIKEMQEIIKKSRS